MMNFENRQYNYPTKHTTQHTNYFLIVNMSFRFSVVSHRHAVQFDTAKLTASFTYGCM